MKNMETVFCVMIWFNGLKGWLVMFFLLLLCEVMMSLVCLLCYLFG